jgi:cation diffusion facilitator CzcD-associated flavoprotein CzcO
MKTCDVVIIGAGPYGLSAAAHLRTIDGLEVSVFGEPMSFWERNMPVGMLLRSNWTATQIADPNRSLTLEAYQIAAGNDVSAPVPLERFVQYGQWYQRAAVPDLDRREIVGVKVEPRGFRLTTDDGDTIRTNRVVIAAGIGSFAWRPQEFQHLSPELASHTSQHQDLRRFANKRILVVGSGQSALESGALLHEGAADVEIVGRAHRIHWLQGGLSRTLHHRLGKFTRQVLYAPTDVGPAGLSQLMARPNLLKCLPRTLQNKLRKRCVRPAGARWLVDRLQEVPIRLGCSIVGATPAQNQVKVRLNDGTERTVDHILLGTGYRVNVSRYDFLSPQISDSISCISGYPVLRQGLESSVPGLHFLGAPAAWSFGPLMQFVSGTHFASRAITRYIAAEPEAARGDTILHGRSALSA